MLSSGDSVCCNEMNNKSMSRIWAGIIVYHPDSVKLKSLVSKLEPQVDRIVIYNNGGCCPEDLCQLFSSDRYEILDCGENVGIGQAVNAICEAASDCDVDCVVTFDQDSAPDVDFVAGLHAFMVPLDDFDKVAAVGPIFIDERSKKELFPIFQAGKWWIGKVHPEPYSNAAISTTMLITSGMLLKLSAWKEIGGFREDFFIDHVDTEWCLRAHAQGFKLYVTPSIVMRHELSDEAPKRVFGRLVLKYSPIRRYYTFRNSIVLIMDSQVLMGNRIYLLFTIGYRFFINLLVDDNKFCSLTAMVTGVIHGLRGKMGRRYECGK
jgi:rhamnosyltransferase